MGVFILNPDIKESIERARKHAEQKEHWYYPDNGGSPPGDNPKHVLQTGTIRAVFSWTCQQDKVFRHLSISTSSSDKYPHQMIVWTMAHLLGFTGVKPDKDGYVQEPSDTWVFMPNPQEGCIVVAEEVKEATSG